MTIASTAMVALLATELLTPIPFGNLQQDTFVSEAGKGELQVSLRQIDMGSSVPLGATRVPLLGLNLAASCDADVRIDEILVRHTGAGDADDFTGVMLNDATRRVSRSSTFDNDGVARLRPTAALTVKKCSSIDLMVAVNLSAQAGVASEHGASIVGADDVKSSAKTVRIVRSQDAVRMKAVSGSTGTVTVNMLSVPGRLRYGRTETVARLQISADAKSDHLLKKITLTNTENARDYQLMNLYLETRSGEVVSLVANHMRAKEVTLLIDPSLLLRGSQTIVLDLKAEINAGAGTKVRFIVEDRADIEATPYRSR